MMFRALLALAAVGLPCLFAQTPVPQKTADGAIIRTGAEEVLLDIVVRDKKGRLVRDLEPNEIEISDDGGPQKLKSFRLAGSGDSKDPALKARPAGAIVGGGLDPLRQIRLVTMVFQGLGTSGRNLARQAAQELLKNESGPNLFFGVFAIDYQLRVLLQYTADKEAVKNAINRATTTDFGLYTEESDRIATELKALAAQNQAGAPIPTNANGAPNAAGAASAAMAQMTLNMIQFSQSTERSQQGRATIFSLFSLIKEQYRLPGRKTLIYFTEGFSVPPELADLFNTTIGMANRANVSVYAVDATGLATSNRNAAAGSLLNQATSSIKAQQTARSGPVTPDQATALDRAADSIQANTQNSMTDLAESTGGFLIANSNDLRAPLRRVMEDIDTHYELSYSPQIDKYDGHFRKISVKIARNDIRVQTRSGYYALPAMEGQSVLPYEVPMLGALASTPIPKNIPYHSSALHFQSKSGGPESAVVIDVPLDGISVSTNQEKHYHQAHLSVLAIYKDSHGGIVRKFSQDVPATAPIDQLEAFRKGHFIYTQHAELSPGRYTLETALLDREGMKVSAKRQAVIVPPPSPGVGLSSLSIVRSIATDHALDSRATAQAGDPFDFPGGKVTPSLDDSVKGGPGAALSLYFTVYSQSGATSPPELSIDFLSDGKPVAHGEPKLPAADQSGRIAYIAETPIGTLKPGQYEVAVTVKQAGKTAQERLLVNID
jgi:VWFA-related protein